MKTRPTEPIHPAAPDCGAFSARAAGRTALNFNSVRVSSKIAPVCGEKRRTDSGLSRRELLRQFAAAGACVPFTCFARSLEAEPLRPPVQATPDPAKPFVYLTPQDEVFLERMERANFLYFWEQVNPKTGLVRDRCNVRANDHSSLGSIAATGFGLTALCIGQYRGYISFEEARDRALAALRFLSKKQPDRGFFYHWADINTGKRLWQSEISSIDTAILLCGILTCRQHFQHSEINQLAAHIFNRVNWQWLSEDTLILPHGWTPETGFLQYRWDNYSELMVMYLMGLGSSSHPLPSGSWEAWNRKIFNYKGIRYIGSSAPIFVHQYSEAWFDFRGKRDAYADYFQNSVLATEAHRRFCMDLSKEFPDYGPNLWGITASDSEHGYQVWGGPPPTGPIDGTVVPCASAGSLPFLPQPAMRVLRNIQFRYGPGTWSRYGFVDAFNPLTNWYDSDIVGIDTGISLVMAENARSGFVWNTFMKNPEAIRGMQRAGFKNYQPALPQELKPTPPVPLPEPAPSPDQRSSTKSNP